MTLDEEIGQILNNHLNILDGRYKEKREKNIKQIIRTCAKHFLDEIEKEYKRLHRLDYAVGIKDIRSIFSRYMEVKE